MQRDGLPAAVGPLADRVVELVAREAPVRFDGRGSGPGVDPDRFRAAVLERALPFVDDRLDT